MKTNDESTAPKPRQVKCPHCGHLTVYSSENPARPFCSERCRLMDLGQWAEGSYRIPVQNLEHDETPSVGEDEESV